jgi:type VI secretion system secreted protein Hcp
MRRKLRIALCVLAPAWMLGALLPTSAPAAVDMFLEVDGLQGESQDSKYKDAIDVLAFSWGVSNGGGKPNFQDVSVTKYVDRTSPKLLEMVASGKLVATARLTVRKPGETPIDYLRYCFTGLRFSALSSGGSGGEDRVTENITFSYSTIIERYTQQDATGKPLPAIFGGWDLLKNLQFGPPTC